MTANTSPESSLQLFAHQVSAQLLARCRVSVPVSEVLDIMDTAVRVAAPEAVFRPLQGAAAEPQETVCPAEEVIRTALADGRTHVLEVTERSARLSVVDPQASAASGLRWLKLYERSDVGERLESLIGVGTPLSQRFSTVVELSGSVGVFVTVRRFDASQGERQVDGYEISAVQAKAPSILLDDLGVTQADRWMGECLIDEGLCLVVGEGVRTTLRATAHELERQGLSVVWVEEADDVEELHDMDVDVYVFTRPLRRPHELRLAAELAGKGVLVLASIRNGHGAAPALMQFMHAGVSLDELGQVLNAVLLQVLVPQAQDNFSPFLDEDLAPTVLSELACFEGGHDIEALVNGRLPLRSIVIDAAEKVRAGDIAEDTARGLVGSALDTYL